MLIDSHCHLDFYDDPHAVLARASEAGVTTFLAIGIGDGPGTMHRALDLARKNKNVFASAGIHPQEAHQATPEALAKLAELIRDPRCVAVGEIGLDYYHLDNPDIIVQQGAFISQMRLAAEARKPILIHCRTSSLATPAAKERYGSADAFADLMSLLTEHWIPTGLPGVMHCFSGSPAEAAQAVAAGFYLSFAGNVTYPRATDIQQSARKTPEDKILLETDSPFLAPIPLRGTQNEPANMVHTTAFVAQLRGTTPEALARLTTENFQRLFPSVLPDGPTTHRAVTS